MNSKYHHEHQRTCNILIKFTYLMASILLYQLTDWETFNYLSALERVRGQTSMMMLLAIIVSNVNLKALTVLARMLILDAWLGPGHASAD